MRTWIMALVVSMTLLAPQARAERYEVKEFPCYLVPLCGIFEGDKMVTAPYGCGEVPVKHLQRLAKKWNTRGVKPWDEIKTNHLISQELQRERQEWMTPRSDD